VLAFPDLHGEAARLAIRDAVLDELKVGGRDAA
jgi:hypothetical protein